MCSKETENLNMTLSMSISQILELFFKGHREYLGFARAIYQRLNFEVTNTFKLIVDYDLTYDYMVMSGHYYDAQRLLDYTHWYGPMIEYVPVEKIIVKKEVSGRLFNCNESTRTEIISQMEKDSFYPADILELLTFGVQYPEIQRILSILSIKSVFKSAGLGPFLACLTINRFNYRQLSYRLFSSPDDNNFDYKDYALGIKKN